MIVVSDGAGSWGYRRGGRIRFRRRVGFGRFRWGRSRRHWQCRIWFTIVFLFFQAKAFVFILMDEPCQVQGKEAPRSTGSSTSRSHGVGAFVGRQGHLVAIIGGGMLLPRTYLIVHLDASTRSALFQTGQGPFFQANQKRIEACGRPLAIVISGQ